MILMKVWLLLVIEGIEAFDKEVEVNDRGEFVIRSIDNAASIVRRHSHEDQEEASTKDHRVGHRLYGMSDLDVRARKIEQGKAHDRAGEGDEDKPEELVRYAAPPWAPHKSMPVNPDEDCTQDVTTDHGVSDYGQMSHSCASCLHKCTEKGMQQPSRLEWHFDPPLSECNAFDVKLYANWSDIRQLGCSDCSDKGLRHKFMFTISSNAKDDKGEVQNFEGWMGPEAFGTPHSSNPVFHGMHVFELADTRDYSRFSKCEEENPKGRWYAIPGDLRAGETFTCKRICKVPPCTCGRNTAMRCWAKMTMTSSQLFEYRIRKVADADQGILESNVFMGAKWEVYATDVTQKVDSNTRMTVVGRVILAGNSEKNGIVKLWQSHEHIGCVPCDLFYESTIVSGPFIQHPVGVHVVRSAKASPPSLTAESCELFRISSLGGLHVMFETGPGMWPPFEVNDTLFTCSHKAKVDTCHA